MIKRITLVIIVFFTVFSVEASMVSFFVIETGLPKEGERNQHSLYWENALLDVFFDAGHIVCNAPILRLETKPSDDILRASAFDMEEARNGGVDFVILAQLDFLSGSLAPPDEVSFFIYSIMGREKIYERRFTGKNYKSARDEIDDLKILAGELVLHLID